MVALVVNCRSGIEHPYDIIEGPMADDQIWDYVEDFMDGNISRDAFWGISKVQISNTPDCILYRISAENVTF